MSRQHSADALTFNFTLSFTIIEMIKILKSKLICIKKRVFSYMYLTVYPIFLRFIKIIKFMNL